MNYTELKTIKHLSNFLRTEVDYLEQIINGNIHIIDLTSEEYDSTPKEESGLFVEKFNIPKKNKSLGFRTVYKPESSYLSSCLVILTDALTQIYEPNQYTHGFVRGRNIKTNADNHLHKKNILSVDIKDYFESITHEMISASLEKLGFTVEVAEMISHISTINGKLVQGYNSSPVIANIVSCEMDKELAEYCGSKINYSRYADDLYFSSNDVIPNKEKIEKIVKSFYFELNNKKTQLMVLGQNQFVTGLSVFDKDYSRIPKRVKRNLRLEIYYIKKFGIQNHVLKKLNLTENQYKCRTDIRCLVDEEISKTIYRINGWFQFINSIEPNVAKKLRKEYSEKIYPTNDFFESGIIIL